MVTTDTEEELIQAIENAIGIFRLFELPESAASVSNFILPEVKKAQIDYDMINQTYKNLQTLTRFEFGKKEDHRRRAIAYLYKRVTVSIQANYSDVRAVHNTQEVADNILNRVNASKVLRRLNKILIKGSEDEEDRLTGLSIAYANAVEGVYKRSIQDCYMWELLASKKHVKSSVVPTMDIKMIMDYYNTTHTEITVFEGYDSTVRNAVGHSTFYFDPNEKKMKYEDKISGNVKLLSFDELYSLYRKIENIYQMVIINTHVLRLSDICLELMERRSEKMGE